MSLLRERDKADSGRVAMVELFFDLVFVFAVTQLSHSLLGDLTAQGLAKVGLLLLAVWWVWIYTSWVTNFLDPERLPVRICLFALMFVGLLLSVSIPHAFDKHGLVFAASYAFMQVARTGFFLWAARGAPERMRRNFQRILAWLSVSAVCWLIGGFAAGETRWLWWALALLIEFAGPWAYFYVPGLGASTTADWSVDGGHLAERCALFVIIALGESLLVTGATFGDQAWNTQNIVALVSAVFGSVLMWWIYFDTGQQRAHHRIAHSKDPGRQGRSAYTYAHTLIVAGIIVCAVADELVIVHPQHGENPALMAILGGPFCYLLGVAWFKWLTNDRRTPPLSHMVGIGLLALLAVPTFLHWLSPLALGLSTTAVMLIVAVWESLAIRRA
ncbi:low temperature requirement protein A [Arenimonas sp.]|uniref:low temperature requirement protein A n=1 Tax=Arenimonas sp. TaxID=1872635 RepID=UPI0039E4DE01